MNLNQRALRRDLAWGLLLGAPAGAAILFLKGWGSLVVLLALALAALAWWMVCGAGRWLLVFLAAALLLPPLPFALGDTGVHPALFAAAAGLWAGLLRLEGWRFRRRVISAAMLLLLFALLESVPMAAIYSSPALAAQSLARVALFGISVYLFLYLADGPGRDVEPGSVIRLLSWAGFLSTAFACLDFYFQFPAPSRFAEQFVWLSSGVFRRAQGVFYEASTLGSFCVFFTVMLASIAARGMHKRLRLSPVLLACGGVAAVTALILSFSRAALVSLATSLAVMLWLERRRIRLTGRIGRWGATFTAGLLGGSALLYWAFPAFLTAYLQRIWYSGVFLASDPNLTLSRRLESWGFLLNYLRDHPWQMMLGIGYKTIPYSSLADHRLVADNMYLSLLVETGWLGLAALLLLNLAVLRESHRLVRFTRADEPEFEMRRLAGLWMFCFWCGESVQMLSGDVLTYWRILPAFFAVLALGVRGNRNRTDEYSLS